MKRLLLSMVALVSVMSMNAQDDLDSLLSVELQNVQVMVLYFLRFFGSGKALQVSRTRAER